jgi:hypothetical protein
VLNLEDESHFGGDPLGGEPDFSGLGQIPGRIDAEGNSDVRVRGPDRGYGPAESKDPVELVACTFDVLLRRAA